MQAAFMNGSAHASGRAGLGSKKGAVMNYRPRIAAVTTFTEVGDGCDEKNMAYAYKAMDEASANGADIICFPETFPGALKIPITFDPFELMSEKAKKIGRYVIYGACVNVPENPAKQYVRNVLLGPDGKEIGHYDRTCPKGPGSWLYEGGSYWKLNWEQGNELPVFHTDIGVIGMLVCSEVFLPELSRALAVQGAEITFLPAGVNKMALNKNWEILIKARAIENLMYTVTCNNICSLPKLDDPSGALGMIVSPEGDTVESREEGIIYADADLERLKFLREADDSWEVTKILPVRRSKTGIFKNWRRPELWHDII